MSDDDRKKMAAEALKKKNRVVALSLTAFIVLVFFVSIVKMSGG